MDKYGIINSSNVAGVNQNATVNIAAVNPSNINSGGTA